MWTCKMCGAENADGAIFCKDCGDRYEPPEEAPGAEIQPLSPDDTPVALPPTLPVSADESGPLPSPSPDREEEPLPMASNIPPRPSPSPVPTPLDDPSAPAANLLVFDREGNVAAEFPLPEGTHLIGITSVPDDIFPEVDLEAQDPDQIVSRRHAVLTLAGDQFLIEDQRSTNGTWVNGQRLRPHTSQQLFHGDDIVFSQRVRARFTVR